MHVLIASDGTLDPDTAARFVARLAGAEGSVTVSTVVEIPRSLLSDLRALYGEQPEARIDRDAEYVAIGSGAGRPPTGWPGDDAMIRQYLEEQRDRRLSPLVAALVQHGIDAQTAVVEGESAAAAIVRQAAQLQVDVVCIGSTGLGLFEGLLGSTGTTVSRRAPCSVLIIR